MIGHGGFGTTMAALAAGVPQVVVPLFAIDQFVNAEQVAAVHAGVQVLGDWLAFGASSGARGACSVIRRSARALTR